MIILKWPLKIFLGLVLLSLTIFIFFGRIPTYHYPQSKLKSMQQEAKTALLAIYAAEASFRKDFHTFTTALYGIGVGCLENVSYSYGFLLSSQNSEANSIVGVTNYNVNKMNCDRTNGTDLETVRSYCTDCTAGKNQFKAIAWTRLPNHRLDIWTIDENKKMVNVLNGIETVQ